MTCHVCRTTRIEGQHSVLLHTRLRRASLHFKRVKTLTTHRIRLVQYQMFINVNEHKHGQTMANLESQDHDLDLRPSQ